MMRESLSHFDNPLIKRFVNVFVMTFHAQVYSKDVIDYQRTMQFFFFLSLKYSVK